MKKNEKSENATLADLPVGASAKIVKILPDMRGKKKFADVGIMPGTELILEAKAPSADSSESRSWKRAWHSTRRTLKTF